MMHFVLQYIHLITFSLLLAVPRYRLTAALLIVSSFIYILLGQHIAEWNGSSLITTYIVSMAIDASFALLTSQYGGKEGCKQALVLVLFSLAHLARTLEHHTPYTLVFNIYVQTTVFLHLLQLGVAYDGIRDFWKDHRPRGLGDRNGVTGVSVRCPQSSKKRK